MDAPSTIAFDGIALETDLEVPDGARAVVVFAHGSGSSRMSHRNRAVAASLRQTGRFGTMLFDLLTPAEDMEYATRFDIPLLSSRLVIATEWLMRQDCCRDLPVVYFGASTGAAAALQAVTRVGERVVGVVSRGGRPDLAGDALPSVHVPTLLIVGGADTEVVELNRTAARLIPGPVSVEIVPGATHLFEEPGALEHVARLTSAFLESLLGE